MWSTHNVECEIAEYHRIHALKFANFTVRAELKALAASSVIFKQVPILELLKCRIDEMNFDLLKKLISTSNPFEVQTLPATPWASFELRSAILAFAKKIAHQTALNPAVFQFRTV